MIFLANGDTAGILLVRHVEGPAHSHVHEGLLLQLHQQRGGGQQQGQTSVSQLYSC